MFASKRIGRGQRVARVLLDTAVTPARALECCKSLLPGASDLPAWTLLAAFLMTHRGDIADASGQSGSSQRRVWAPYVAALPERTGTVLEAALYEPTYLEPLRGSPSMLLACDIVASFVESWAELRPMLHEAEKAGRIEVGNASLERAVWAWSIVTSRCARFASVPDVEALVPWIDMFNHSPSATCYIDADRRAGEVFVAADRAYKAGDQVFISYGPKSSTDLFLTYGFAPGETNPHETAPVVLGVLPKGGTPDSGGPSGRLASAMADDRRLDAMDAFTPELPDGQRALVARVGLNGAIPTGLVELAAEISGGGRKEGLALLADACSSARKSYAKDIDTNKKLLAAAEEASRLPSLAPSGGGKEEGDRRASSELEMLQRVEGLLPESLVKSTAKRSQLDGSSVSAKHLPALRAVVAEQRVLAGAEFALRRAARAA